MRPVTDVATRGSTDNSCLNLTPKKKHIYDAEFISFNKNELSVIGESEEQKSSGSNQRHFFSNIKKRNRESDADSDTDTTWGKNYKYQKVIHSQENANKLNKVGPQYSLSGPPTLRLHIGPKTYRSSHILSKYGPKSYKSGPGPKYYRRTGLLYIFTLPGPLPRGS